MTMKRIIVFAPILSMIIGLTVISQAEIYKWTDENGAVHFSDSPVDLKSKDSVGTMGEIKNRQDFDDGIRGDDQLQRRTYKRQQTYEMEKQERDQIREEARQNRREIQDREDARSARARAHENEREARARAEREKKWEEKKEIIEDIQRDMEWDRRRRH